MVLRNQLEALVEQMVDRGIRFDEAREEFEKKFIKRALEKTLGNYSRAATVLGIHRNTLSRKIERYNLDNNNQQHR
jgi:DNA-binding NtrC family response regulator